MDGGDLTHPLDAVAESELVAIGRWADRLLAARPVIGDGPWRRRHRPGPGFEFLDYQPCEPGQDARTVDWKASQRAGTPLWRRRRDEAAAEWHICLDRSASMALPDPAKWDLARQVAAAFLFLMIWRGNRCGLMLFDDDLADRLPPGRGRAHYARALALLAAARPADGGGDSRPAACARGLGPRRSALVISDFLRPDTMRPDLLDLRRMGGRVQAVQILSDDETRPPGTGPGRIRDAESGEARTLTDPAKAARAARDALAKHGSRLALACAEDGLPFSAWTTGTDWRSVVVGHLGGLTHV